MDMTRDTAKFVRDARDRLGLSQPEFGKLVGRGGRSIMRYEQGDPLPLEIELAIQHMLSKFGVTLEVTEIET
jgi:transcriptional regulator with XRE-family HTH domain